MALARVILDRLERCLHAHAGLDLPSWVVESRALARMGALDLAPQAYVDLVTSPRGAGELAALVEAVRVGETRFFRHRPQVDALLSVVVPAFRERDERRLRVWSAGCATGEEAYTLALVLRRALPPPRYTVSILATDVSAEALVVARRGVYSEAAAAGVPEEWRDGLIEEGGGVRVRPEVAGMVTFEQQNLADAGAPRGFDVVWCRNVLIYFGAEARRRVLAKLVGALRPGGFLFVGSSETLRDVAGLAAIRSGDQVLWQKGGESRAPAAGGRLSVDGRSRPGRDRRSPAGGEDGSPARRDRGSPAEGHGGSPAGVEQGISRGRRIVAADRAALAAAIREVLGEPGGGTVTIDLDSADCLDDELAPVLRRAVRAGESVGMEIVLAATRAGPRAWLRRHGLGGGGQ